MRNEDDEIDFDYISTVAQNVTDVLLNDQKEKAWYNQIINDYYKSQQFPNDLINHITDYLYSTKKKENVDLVDKINAISKEEENIENLISSIFFPSSEEEAEADFDQQIIFAEEEEEEEQVESDNHDPESYFEKIILEMMDTLYVSHDIAYILLKKYLWNKDKLSQEWFSHKDEVLKVLKSAKIDFNSELIPDQKSSLSMKKIGVGECVLCYEKGELYKLYCGHTLCEECWINEIQHQLKENNLVLCRQECGAEIMPHDIKKFLDPSSFEKYNRLVVQREIALNPFVKECPNGDCNCIITPLDSLPCHVGRCPCCSEVTCLKCNRGAHAPLIKCDKIDDFLTTISEQMAQLEQDQESWFKREAELKEYRKQHIDEVTRILEQEIKKIVDKHNKQIQEEKQRISEVETELNNLQNNISKLLKEKARLESENKSPQEVEKIKRQVDELHETYNQKAGYKERLQRDKRVNDSERKNELNTAKKEETLFLDAIRDPSMYQRKMYEFEMSLNTRAYQNVSITSNDDDLVSTMTKKCPKCHTPIERNDGCNHMTCQICKYQFCYVCEEPWETHSNYYVCPKYKKDVVIKKTKGKSQCGINFDDKSDKKFYPLPMTIEKRINFMRWNNLYTQFRIKREKYDALYKELHNKIDEKLEKNMKTLPLHKLCPINRLSKILEQAMNEIDARKLATKILNTILFAHSIVVWGYPSMFYMMNEEKKATVFEFKLSQIDEFKNKLLELLHECNANTKASDFMVQHDLMNKAILDVLEMAETFV